MPRQALPISTTFLLIAAGIGCGRAHDPIVTEDAETPQCPSIAASQLPSTVASSEPAQSAPIDAPIPSMLTPGHPYEGGSWARCANGFRSSGDTSKDLTRLTYLCGPYHGMQRYPKRWTDTLGTSAALHDLALQRGDCIRVFAVAAPTGAAFSVTVSVGDKLVGHADGRDGFAVVNPTGAICSPAGGEATIGIRSDAPHARVSTEAWILR